MVQQAAGLPAARFMVGGRLTRGQKGKMGCQIRMTVPAAAFLRQLVSRERAPWAGACHSDSARPVGALRSAQSTKRQRHLLPRLPKFLSFPGGAAVSQAAMFEMIRRVQRGARHPVGRAAKCWLCRRPLYSYLSAHDAASRQTGLEQPLSPDDRSARCIFSFLMSAGAFHLKMRGRRGETAGAQL